MRYYVRLGSRTVEVEIEGGRVTVDGTSYAAHLAAVPGTSLFHLLLSGESWTVAVEPVQGPGDGGVRYALGVAGERLEVEVVDERTRRIQGLTGSHPGTASGGTIRAPMPGLVVRLEVGEGQRVAPGAGLVVIEAMKMENELRATRGGVVVKVHVAAGQAVEKGAALVTLAGPEPSG